MYSIELQELYDRVIQSIAENVAEKGVASKHNNNVVIQITEDSNLGVCLDENKDAYLDEVGTSKVYDQFGYTYDFSVLGYDNLTELADYLELI